MAELEVKPEPVMDPVWKAMRDDAAAWATGESALASWLHAAVLDQAVFEDALAYLISEKLGGPVPPELSAQFVAASLVTTAVFWTILGWLSGTLYRRFS